MFRMKLPKILLPMVAITLLITASAQADEQLKIYVDPDQDGIYEKIRSYDVTYEEAVTAFISAGGSPEKGYPGERLTAFLAIPGSKPLEPQSSEGWIEFLDKTYTRSDTEKLPMCDDWVEFPPPGVEWDCNLSCPPDVNLCDGFFANGYTIYKCINTPPCPSPSTCRKLKYKLRLATIDFTGNPPCECGFDDCEEPGGTVIVGGTFIGDACECFEPGEIPPIPTTTNLGLLILVGLLLMSGLYVAYRRRRVMDVQ